MWLILPRFQSQTKIVWTSSATVRPNKIPLAIPAFYLRVPGFQSQSWCQPQLPASVHHETQYVMAQAFLFLPSTWETRAELLATSWPNHGCYRHLREHQIADQPLSITTPPSLSNKQFSEILWLQETSRSHLKGKWAKRMLAGYNLT